MVMEMASAVGARPPLEVAPSRGAVAGTSHRKGTVQPPRHLDKLCRNDECQGLPRLRLEMPSPDAHLSPNGRKSPVVDLLVVLRLDTENLTDPLRHLDRAPSIA